MPHPRTLSLLKGLKKDTSCPKSYRHIGLLTVLGKITEKTINRRLSSETANNLSGKQYGFTANRSTEDAIRNFREWNKKPVEKHCITVFLDITEAFDNLDWTALLDDLADLGASIATRCIISSYLQGRTASLTSDGVGQEVKLTRGCLQGLI